jgi:anti-sigma B factor antagonist
MLPAALERSEVDGVTVLRLSGSLTEPGVQRIEQAFCAAARAASRVVVDLSGVDVINTPGIGMILGAARELKLAGGKLAVSGATLMVEQSLRLCRLDMVLPIVERVEAGIAAVGQ